MPVVIDDMTVDVDQQRPEEAPRAPAPAASVDTWLRQLQTALADEDARRQRLIAD